MSLRRASVAVATLAWLLVGGIAPGGQERPRINRAIEALAAGRPAISGDVWIFIDQEHSPYLVDQLGDRLRAIADDRTPTGQQRLAPLVRVPTEGDQDVRWVIKQVLERGAMGIIVPQVDDAAQALKILQAVRFPQRKASAHPTPVSRRSFAGAPRTWGLDVLDYITVAAPWPLRPEGELIVLPMIESRAGVDNVGAILDVPGVTGVLVGPSDLAMGLGEGPWYAGSQALRPPDTQAAIAQVAAACVARAKACGMVTWTEAETEQYLDAGYRIIFATYRR